MTDPLLLIALVCGIVHIVMDLRSIALHIRHPKDGLLTVIGLAALTGHLVTDYMR